MKYTIHSKNSFFWVIDNIFYLQLSSTESFSHFIISSFIIIVIFLPDYF